MPRYNEQLLSYIKTCLLVDNPSNQNMNICVIEDIALNIALCITEDGMSVSDSVEESFYNEFGKYDSNNYKINKIVSKIEMFISMMDKNHKSNRL